MDLKRTLFYLGFGSSPRHPAGPTVQAIITLTKGDYSIPLYISKTSQDNEDLATLDLVGVARLDGHKLVRDAFPQVEGQGVDGYFFRILSNTADGVYNKSFKNGEHYYSIYYYLPSLDYDQSVISEADEIVSTLRFR